MHDASLASAIVQKAHDLGFDHCHIAAVTDAPHADFFDAWIEAGRAGEMHYLARDRDKRRSPRLLGRLGGPVFRSMIVLGVDYHQFDLPDSVRDDPSRGIIARYAWGDDYHEVIRPLLYKLDGFIRHQTGRTALGKCLVDSGPVLERDWALRAGLGFTGKNCCTIRPGAGSWLLLATILIPEVLPASGWRATTAPTIVPTADVLAGLPPAQSYGSWSGDGLGQGRAPVATCGRCTRCLDQCPTAAFVGPFHLDPQRCIAYWTIESQSPIPLELRPLFGNRIFGCDICQEVCPWNRRLAARTPLLAQLQAQQERVAPLLLQGFAPQTPYWLDTEAFAHHFANSPILRAQRAGMARNVCVALGNWADPCTIPALTLALDDGEALVRGHAAWALGMVARRHRHSGAVSVLAARLAVEEDSWVRSEFAGALALA